jgi:hypothetical protein
MEKATTALQQREHVTFTAQVDVDKAQAIGRVKVDEAEGIGAVEIKKAKWNMLLKIAAGLGALGTAIATALAAKGC